jgi:hypothetical protein
VGVKKSGALYQAVALYPRIACSSAYPSPAKRAGTLQPSFSTTCQGSRRFGAFLLSHRLTTKTLRMNAAEAGHNSVN